MCDFYERYELKWYVFEERGCEYGKRYKEEYEVELLYEVIGKFWERVSGGTYLGLRQDLVRTLAEKR